MFCFIRKLNLTVILSISIATCSCYFASTKAIIFDCDGVLVDTEYLKFEAWKEALSRRSITFTLDDYIPLVGYSSEKIAEEIVKKTKKNLNKNMLIQEKNEIYRKRQVVGVPPIQEVVVFLKRLLANKIKYNIKVGLASSASHAEIISNLHSIGVSPKDFDVIASGEEDLKHIIDPEGTNKPKPYIYQIVARSLNIRPEYCIVFEDTHAGIEAASAAGMRVFGVSNKFTKSHDFSKTIGIINFKHINYNEFLSKLGIMTTLISTNGMD